jgi:hypothetical protein
MEYSVRSVPSREQARRASCEPAAPNAPRLNNPGGNQANLRRLQAKLTVGAVNDPLEREADAAADQVMRMADARVSLAAPPTLSRKCEKCEEEYRAAPLQRKARGDGMTGEAAPPIVDRVLASPGRALDPATSSFMGQRFGADFSDVRIHTDGQAARSAAAVHARAYTVGRDVVFGAGQYDPGGETGRHLLAHELAHTLQQGGGARRAPFIQRKIHVGAGLSLDTMGYTVTKSGDTYSAPKAVRTGSVWNEIFTSLLASPRTFNLAGSSNAEINANRLAHMKARLGVVEFAANKKYSFGAGSNFKMNPDFWVNTGTGWDVKPGVDRQKAIEDLNNPKNVGDPAHEYKIACEAATQLTMEGGAKSSSMIDDVSGDTNDWVPGDWGYITNIKFPASGGIPGLEGENIIYVGNGKQFFWGHFNPGIEYKTLDDWIAEVNSFTPPTQARLENQRTYTNVGLT